MTYYPVEPVRDFIIAGNYELKEPIDDPVPLDTWIKHPCLEESNCVKIECTGNIQITVNVGDGRTWIYLQILYFKEKQRAFIRTDNPQMMSLISIGALTYESLECHIESF